MPGRTQVESIGGPLNDSSGSAIYVTEFDWVKGGYYGNGDLQDGSGYGFWWSNTAAQNSGNHRISLRYYNSDNALHVDSGYRNPGLYIRCVSEEKDVSDLTYMQDMTPSVATSILARFHLLRKICYLNPLGHKIHI